MSGKKKGEKRCEREKIKEREGKGDFAEENKRPSWRLAKSQPVCGKAPEGQGSPEQHRFIFKSSRCLRVK